MILDRIISEQAMTTQSFPFRRFMKPKLLRLQIRAGRIGLPIKPAGECVASSRNSFRWVREDEIRQVYEHSEDECFIILASPARSFSTHDGTMQHDYGLLVAASVEDVLDACEKVRTIPAPGTRPS